MVHAIRHVQHAFKRNQLDFLKNQQSGGNIDQQDNVFTRSINYEIGRLNDILRTQKRRGKQTMDQARDLKASLEEEIKRDDYRPQVTSSKANESSEWRRANKFWTAKDAEDIIKESTSQLNLIKDLSEQNPNADFSKQKDTEEKKLNNLMQLRSELLRAQRIREKQKSTRAGYKDLSLYEKNLKAKLEKKVKRLEYKSRFERIKIRQKETAKKRLEKLKEYLKSKRKADIANRAGKRFHQWSKIVSEAKDKIWESKDKSELRKALLTSFAAQDGVTSSTVDYITNKSSGQDPQAVLPVLKKEINSINKLYMLDEPITPAPVAKAVSKRKVLPKPRPILKRKRETAAAPPPSVAISVPVAYNTRSRAKSKSTSTQLKKRRRR